jgi:cell division protein ZapB
MNENTLPQLEQLIENIIDKNNQLKSQIAELAEQKAGLAQQVAELAEQKALLVDENEIFQLEVLEGEEKQKQTNNVLTALLAKLQSAEELS